MDFSPTAHYVTLPQAFKRAPQKLACASSRKAVLRADARSRCAPASGSMPGTNARRGRAVPAGSPWQATQIVLVLYWNPLLLRTELIRSIWIYCSINSSTGNPVRRVEYPGCVLVHYVMSTVWNSLRCVRALYRKTAGCELSQIFQLDNEPGGA